MTSRSLFQRLLGVGTVTVLSSDKTSPSLVLKNIKDPMAVKELLHQSPWPHFTLLGRKGGSAVAAACVNALAELALARRE